MEDNGCEGSQIKQATSIFKGALGSVFGPHSFNCIIPLPLEQFLVFLFVVKKEAVVPSLMLYVCPERFRVSGR
jgi:hypothetical protein